MEFDDFLVQIGVDDPEGFKECLKNVGIAFGEIETEPIPES